MPEKRHVLVIIMCYFTAFSSAVTLSVGFRIDELDFDIPAFLLRENSICSSRVSRKSHVGTIDGLGSFTLRLLNVIFLHAGLLRYFLLGLIWYLGSSLKSREEAEGEDSENEKTAPETRG